MNKEDKKEVIIEVIDTPRGPVPSAESLKSLVNAWNEILLKMNKTFIRISDNLLRLNENISNILIGIKTLQNQIDIFSSRALEIKIGLNRLDSKLEDIICQLKQNFRYTVHEKEDFAQEIKDVFGKESKISKKSRVGSSNISDLLRRIKLEKASRMKIPERAQKAKVIIISGDEKRVLSFLKGLSIKIKKEPYFLDVDKIGSKHFEIDLIDILKAEIIVVVENAELFTGLPSIAKNTYYPLAFSKLVKELKGNPQYPGVLILWTNAPEMIDPDISLNAVKVNLD